MFYNQAEDQDWPTPREGPFREAWSEAAVDTMCLYGRVPSDGAESGGGAFGVPFAIVETAEPCCVATSQSPIGYRFCARGRTRQDRAQYSWTQCPQAAYCWVAGALTNPPATCAGRLTPVDLIEAGGVSSSARC